MAKKIKQYCKSGCSKTEHEITNINRHETLVCMRCEIPLEQQPDNRPGTGTSRESTEKVQKLLDKEAIRDRMQLPWIPF